MSENIECTKTEITCPFEDPSILKDYAKHLWMLNDMNTSFIYTVKAGWKKYKFRIVPSIPGRPNYITNRRYWKGSYTVIVTRCFKYYENLVTDIIHRINTIAWINKIPVAFERYQSYDPKSRAVRCEVKPLEGESFSEAVARLSRIHRPDINYVPDPDHYWTHEDDLKFNARYLIHDFLGVKTKDFTFATEKIMNAYDPTSVMLSIFGDDAILGGSYAFGIENKYSDIDVILPNDTNVSGFHAHEFKNISRLTAPKLIYKTWKSKFLINHFYYQTDRELFHVKLYPRKLYNLWKARICNITNDDRICHYREMVRAVHDNLYKKRLSDIDERLNDIKNSFYYYNARILCEEEFIKSRFIRYMERYPTKMEQCKVLFNGGIMTKHGVRGPRKGKIQRVWAEKK